MLIGGGYAIHKSQTNIYQSIRGDPSNLSSGAESQSAEVVATFSSYLGERDDDLQFFGKVPDNLSTDRHKLNDRMQIASKREKPIWTCFYVQQIQRPPAGRTASAVTRWNGRCLLSLRPPLRDLHRRRALLAHALGSIMFLLIFIVSKIKC